MPSRRRPGPAPPPFHPSAGTWAAAGNRFTKLHVVPPVPLGAYRGKISSVPLTGGQAQGTIPGVPGATGSDASPAPFALFVPATIPVAGTYMVNWSGTLSGTLSGGDANNFALYQISGGVSTRIATGVNAAAAGTYPQAPVTVNALAGDQVAVTNPGAGTSGSLYAGTITSLATPLTLSAGPQGLGTVWYPAQVTLSTATGALDTSNALVYLGTAGVPTMQVASVFTGNGTAALAVPPMQPGEFIIVTWTNGHPGDFATFNILGTMDALTTGRG